MNRSLNEWWISPSEGAVQRLLVLDGSNIARAASGPNRQQLSCAGLLSTLRWIAEHNFEPVVFVPITYNNANNLNTTHAHLLRRLEQLQVLTFTPARQRRAERGAFINYDDLIILEYAYRHGGCVMSGDHYKDILAKEEYAHLSDVVRNGRIDVHFVRLPSDWVECGHDKWHKYAPILYVGERRNCPLGDDALRRRLWLSPDDGELYQRATTRRLGHWSSSRRAHLLSSFDDLFYELYETSIARPLKMDPVSMARHLRAFRISCMNTIELGPVPSAEAALLNASPSSRMSSD